MLPRMRLPALVLVAAVASSMAVSAPRALELSIDPEHSNVGFSVRHLFTRVHGKFREFSGSLVFDEADPSKSKVTATIQVVSIDTNVEARDKDLRSARFFDAQTFPTLTFVTQSVKDVSGGRFKVIGTLTMHGVSKQVTLDAEFIGKGEDPWGNLRYGFHAATKVDRKEFDMTWNEVIEAGGVLVGDEVEISLDIEAVPAE